MYGVPELRRLGRSATVERASDLLPAVLGESLHGRTGWIRTSTAAAVRRTAWALPFVALAGVAVGAGLVLKAYSLGAWPLHDTADYWLAGRHVLEGAPVYRIDHDGFLNFIYGPPWAILWAPISLLPLPLVCVLLIVAQVVAFRYIAGSWVAVGLLCWLPAVSGEFTTGNVDFLMGAAILAAVRGRTWPVVLFAFAKIAPAFVLLRASRRGWIEAIATGFVLVALTLPWIGFWPQWLAVMLANPAGAESVIPVLVRVPLALVLGGIPRPWALAAATGLLTPSFHAHTWVVLIPAVRLWWDGRHGAVFIPRATYATGLWSKVIGDTLRRDRPQVALVPVQVARATEVRDHRSQRQW
jgi:hypothetical protein